MLLNGEQYMNVKEKEIETSEYKNLETATNKVLLRIAAEPAYKIVLYKILEYCDCAHPSDDVERFILSMPEMKGAMHPPKLLLSWLEDAGGIEQLAAEKEERLWCTTLAGRKVVRMESFNNRLGRLLDQEARYQDVYLQVLRACQFPKSRMEIESMLNDNPILQEPKVYPSFFIENLEAAGGLEWDEKWKTTLAGKDFLNG